MILGLIIDIFHLLFMFIPFILIFIPKQQLKKYRNIVKIVFLVFILVPAIGCFR